MKVGRKNIAMPECATCCVKSHNNGFLHLLHRIAELLFVC